VTKFSVGYVVIKEPNGKFSVMVGAGKIWRVDENRFTEIVIIKHGDISFPVEFQKVVDESP